MSNNTDNTNRRILVIDDNQAIHNDFRKILCERGGAKSALDDVETELFGDAVGGAKSGEAFEIESAFQGQEGLDMVRKALQEGRPYAMAFVDMRMPPGWDGIETVTHIWEEDPNLQVVFCTAYSDYSWDEMVKTLSRTAQWLILKKPFDNVEASQLASALTEKWNLAKQARCKMGELEQAVEQRTREIEEQKDYLQDALARLHEAHAQLLQADKMASIGQLAAGVAHEINNPIGFISSNLNSLGQYVDDVKRVLGAYEELARELDEGQSEARGKAEQIRDLCREVDMEYLMSDVSDLISESAEGAQRVRQIVADLRDFSHVDSPDVREEDINSLMDKTVNVAWNELKYKTEVVREYGDIPAISCYGGKIGQVFLNLLVNAAHAIKKHGTITIRSGADDEQVWIEVSDSGCGIPPENLKRIFDPFFTTKDVGKGTGMGLHLAYKIIEAHQGRIKVESTVDKGTTFRIELPIAGPPEVKETQNVSVA